MADLNLVVGGPVLAALQLLASITMGIISHLDKQLEFASEADKHKLMQQRLRHEDRLNWTLDQIFGLFGYVPGSGSEEKAA